MKPKKFSHGDVETGDGVLHGVHLQVPKIEGEKQGRKIGWGKKLVKNPMV